ncbi:alpha/beta hydrolase [Geomonas limicola]|uniref:Alpha/beta hydrolase n=1 Tax=Geomonas limicola TaxID=2740186 RepID=A0A6V8NBS5_9BACT|nr:alpha/beta hydrolase [Geomonas limicola]GFO70072.1 alpha/beta hydrolase [Geomonas limicola]
MAYYDEGSGPVVLLLHGFPLNRQMWQTQIQPLAQAGYRVIAPDLPGFGTSEAPATGYSMDSFADAIVGLLDALDIRHAVIGGMSMGGYILCDLLERYPERVSAACFITTKSAADDEEGRARRTTMAAQAERLGANPIIKIFAELLFAPETSQTQPALIAQVTAWMRSTAPGALAGGLIAMRDRKDYTPLLSGFQHPSLVLFGQEDRAGSPRAVDVFRAGLPNCESQIIPGGGHMVNMEKPELFNAKLLDFLNRIRETL